MANKCILRMDMKDEEDYYDTVQGFEQRRAA